nr:MAG TPA: hypothetical protein [Caudoviricetes sp.]
MESMFISYWIITLMMNLILVTRYFRISLNK